MDVRDITILATKLPEEQGMDAVSHVTAVGLQHLQQLGRGEQGEGLGGGALAHPQGQTQAGHPTLFPIHLPSHLCQLRSQYQ